MALFETGKLSMRRSLIAYFCANDGFEAFLQECLKRHSEGDFGTAIEGMVSINQAALVDGRGLVTSYYEYVNGDDKVPIVIGTTLEEGVTYIDSKKPLWEQ